MARYVLLLFGVIHLGLGNCTAMRIVPFRDVLNGVAFRMGLDPDQSNFLSNQAVPIGEYINAWVRRTFDAHDYPEWVVTHKFLPSAGHIVAWDAAALDTTDHAVLQIGRVIDVFLVDPSTTDAPVDTPPTLREEGIHVGYEHGTYVWVRFMPVPPQYTAVEWRADTIFAKNDVTYSYTTGQVYKSKSNGNLGHDPAGNWGRPPIHTVLEPEPPSPAPTVETTQVWTPDNAGVDGRSQIVKISFINATPPILGTDPPPNMSNYGVEVHDVNGVPLAGESVSADGVKTINDLLDEMQTQLVAVLPVTFAVTVDHSAKTLTLQDDSNFSIYNGGTEYIEFGSDVVHFLQVIQDQSYIPAFSAASGQPQITRVSMTDDSTVPGSTYSLNVTDSGGTLHTVTYASQLYDSAAQILQGLLLAAEAAQLTDTFWTTVQFTFDPSAVTLDLSVRDTFSVDAPAPPPGSAWWELVPFPKALADQVMTGSLGDLYGEWGQTDKQSAQQQNVGQEVGVAEGKFNTMPTPELSGQQAPLSRYKVQ